MNISNIQDEIKEYSQKTESLFLRLADRFPALMDKDEGSAMDNLLSLFNNLAEQNKSTNELESKALTGYDEKYKDLFADLSQKISDLSTVNDEVRRIKDFSEEMELIALNAMVISIKSGEKGRAFSSITDNLKTLSTDMNISSNKLLEEEEALLSYIKKLQTSFDTIRSAQNALSEKGKNSTSDVHDLITNASIPLNDIKAIIDSVYTPIQKAMEGLQLQDIIRQALDHVTLCLDEFTPLDESLPASEETLDSITFDIALMRLAKSVLVDISKNLKSSISTFKDNWAGVQSILDQVEPKRSDYVRRFLDENVPSPDNIITQLEKLNTSFTDLMKMFSEYQMSQKDLEKNTNNITDKAHSMFSVFETLKPLVERLHHVRILQQIEVAKNPAISSVRDSVTDMDNLINRANVSLNQIQDLLMGFISQIKDLLTKFTTSIYKDNEQIFALKTTKNNFLTELRTTQESLTSILQSFSVYPPGFEQQCINVQIELDSLQEIDSAFLRIMQGMEEEFTKLEERRHAMLNELQIGSWELKNDKFKNLIEHFTITAHKENAGAIGNFGVEKGTPSGEITFF